jgi:diguanylate cyclase (GGDEF)-like protein
MLAIIESVADLVDVRDRDDLEVTLASVMFDLVGASTLSLWRVIRRDGGIRFRERVHLDAAGLKLPAPRAADRGLNRMRAELRMAYGARRYSRARGGASRSGRHVFPITDGSDVLGLLEIELDPPLSGSQEQVVLGLLRIYRSHLGVLEYGDRDELTDLSNRRPFDEAFRRVAASRPSADGGCASGSGPRAQLAIADIDFFKRINDQFGHPYGDEVLVLLSGLMRSSFREPDRMFRFGGEEFVLLLADADSGRAELALERFRAAVEAFSFPQVKRVTISIRVTEIHPGDTGSAAYGRADEALYVAKGGGRNQVRRYERLVAQGILVARKAVGSEIEMF